MAIIYTDYLSMHVSEKAAAVRTKLLPLMIQHRNGLLKILEKTWLVPKAFSFITWAQLLLGTRDFTHHFGKLKQVYRDDQLFQKYLASDARDAKRKVDENQINFFLEEILVDYFFTKGKITINNEFIGHHEKWILNCYPGKPIRTLVYLYQKNFFDLCNPLNKYENSLYDPESKLLYDCTKVDMPTFRF